MTGRILGTLTIMVLLAGCATTHLPPAPEAASAVFDIRSVAVGPVAYATHQPGEMCSTFIDEDLRSALILELRQRGYEAFAVGNSVPRTFAAGPPPPLPGDPPPGGPGPLPGAQGLLQVWIEEYFENTLCSWEGPKYLTMGTVGVLYAGSPLREVWRHRARAAEQGDYRANDLIWLTTTRLAGQLLQSLPAGPARSGER